MKFLLFAMAGYIVLVLETTLVPELLGAGRFGVVLWSILPFVAWWLTPATGVVFAATYGLAIDVLGGGRLGVCSVLCVLGVLVLQRAGSAQSLQRFGRTIGVTFATSVAMSMTLFAIETLLHLRHWSEQPHSTPSALIGQLLATSLAGAVVAGLVSTPSRIIGKKSVA